MQKKRIVPSARKSSFAAKAHNMTSKQVKARRHATPCNDQYHHSYLMDAFDRSHLFTVPMASFLLYLIVHYISFLDMNRRIYNHVPGECGFIGGLEKGAVDMAYLDESTLIISTGTDPNNATNTTQGALAVWPIGQAMATELEFTGKSPANLNPMGISVHAKTIMVINNRKNKMDTDSVEVLEIVQGKLKRKRKPITSRHFTSLVSIVALNGKEFYATNQFIYRTKWVQWIEFAGHFRSGSLLHFDGRTVSPVLKRLRQPTGLAKDGNKLYVALFGDMNIHVYDVSKAKNPQKLEEIPLKSAPFFLAKEPKQNAFTVAVHSLKLRSLAHFHHPAEYLAPSQVVRFKKTKSGNWSFTQMYCNDGATIRGATSALRIPGNMLLIGNLDRGILKCHLTSV